MSDGPDKGRLVSIVDVIDQTRVLVDGPCTNVQRKVIYTAYTLYESIVLNRMLNVSGITLKPDSTDKVAYQIPVLRIDARRQKSMD